MTETMTKDKTDQREVKRPKVKFVKTFYLYLLWPVYKHICPTCGDDVDDDAGFYCVLDEFDMNRAIEVFLARKPFEMFCEWCIENNVTDRSGRTVLLKEIMYRVWEAEANSPSETLEGVKIVRVFIPREISIDVEEMWQGIDGEISDSGHEGVVNDGEEEDETG
jgi:hypothetical protein